MDELIEDEGHCRVTERDRRHQRHINYWALGWVLSWLLLSQGLKAGWLPLGLAASALVFVPLALGIGLMVVYRRFLQQADELLRKIHLEALAFSAGATLVGSVTYSLLVEVGIFVEEEISVVIMILSFTYIAAIVRGYRRYS